MAESKYCRNLEEIVLRDESGCQHGKCKTCFYKKERDSYRHKAMARKLKKKGFYIRNVRYSYEFFYRGEDGITKKVPGKFIEDLYKQFYRTGVGNTVE